MVSPDSVEAWATDETKPLVSPSASQLQNWPKSLFWAPICVSRFLVLAMIGLLKSHCSISQSAWKEIRNALSWFAETRHWGPRTMIFGSVSQILLARVRLSTQHRLSYFVTPSYGRGENFQGLYSFLHKNSRTFQGLSRTHFPFSKDSNQCIKDPWICLIVSFSTKRAILSWRSFCVRHLKIWVGKSY